MDPSLKDLIQSGPIGVVAVVAIVLMLRGGNGKQAEMLHQLKAIAEHSASIDKGMRAYAHVVAETKHSVELLSKDLEAQKETLQRIERASV